MPCKQICPTSKGMWCTCKAKHWKIQPRLLQGALSRSHSPFWSLLLLPQRQKSKFSLTHERRQSAQYGALGSTTLKYLDVCTLLPVPGTCSDTNVTPGKQSQERIFSQGIIRLAPRTGLSWGISHPNLQLAAVSSGLSHPGSPAGTHKCHLRSNISSLKKGRLNEVNTNSHESKLFK